MKEAQRLGARDPQDRAAARLREEAMGLLIRAAPRHRGSRRQLGLLAEGLGDQDEAARRYLQAINAGDYQVFADLARARCGQPASDMDETTKDFEVAYGLDAEGVLLKPW